MKKSKFITHTPPKPASLAFKDGCRLRWADTDQMQVEIVRCGGSWVYITVDQENEYEDCYAGDPCGSTDEIYATEVLDGLWVEF